MQIEVMKTEVITYQTLTDSIKPLVDRKDGKGEDTFDMWNWWKSTVQNYQHSQGPRFQKYDV